MSEAKASPLLVIGAGIAGVTAALEAAETGSEVVLVECEPSIGGRVLRINNYFPKLCPPSCGMEINTRRLERNPRIRVMTSSRVTAAERTDTGWSVTVTTEPAWVNDLCTACGDCQAACETVVPNPHNLDLDTVKAIRLPHANAWPKRFVFSREAVGDDEAKRIADACSYGAVDLDAQPTTETLEVGAVVVATGWRPYPLENLEELGGGKFADVIANVQMERMASSGGPTAGKILRPSDGEPPKRVAFVQCAGSRDVNHLNYCSGICCLASLKQATYVKEQLPDAEVTMFYIDRRAPGRNEDFLLKVAEIEGVKLVKGKVGRIEQGNGALKLHVEDVEQVKLIEAEADLVVLATGMVPNAVDDDLALFTRKDEEGFVLDDLDSRVTVAGVARRPEDVAASVRDATGAAARAVIAAGGRA
ncbi:MAG TPA: FAD-dependent oxidoreductase [Candidatus Sulfomarinibacteraceae bacterium]|nr:FAD-dependent oxidoreductase [Candidatus Sulfomarinibacteraceae bacterium]